MQRDQQQLAGLSFQEATTKHKTHRLEHANSRESSREKRVSTYVQFNERKLFDDVRMLATALAPKFAHVPRLSAGAIVVSC